MNRDPLIAAGVLLTILIIIGGGMAIEGRDPSVIKGAIVAAAFAGLAMWGLGRIQGEG